MPLFFIILFFFYLIGNTYIYLRGWQALGSSGKVVKSIYTVLFVCIALMFFTQFGLRGKVFEPSVGHWVHQLGTGWLILSLYMVLWLLAADLAMLTARIFKAKWITNRLRYKQFRKISFWGGFLLIICILSIGYYRYQHPRTEVINIVINKPVNTPEKQIKVVAISDVHLGYGTDKQQLKRYVEMINAQQPDMILIGGDLIDNSIIPVKQEKMHEELAALHAPMGIYMVAGNHEYISDINACKEFLKSTPIHLLQDSVCTLPNGIQIAGRDDRHNRSRLSLSSLLNGTDKNKPLLLLDHQPYNLKESVKAGIDLQFSGHTHRGQIWPVSLLTDRIFEVSHGLKTDGNSFLYVSSGLSLWGPPFRIGTQSELIVFNLCFK